MKKKSVTKKRSVEEKPVYQATVKILGKLYEASGNSISEAILGLKPKNVKGLSILTIQRGDVKKERVLMPRITSRLFNTAGLTKEVALKNASILFQGI